MFLDFEEVADDAEGHWRQLAESLGGRGVPSLRDALRRILLRPVHEAMERVFDPQLLERLTEWRGRAAARPRARRAGRKPPGWPARPPGSRRKPAAGRAARGSVRAARALAAEIIARARPFLEAPGPLGGGRAAPRGGGPARPAGRPAAAAGCAGLPGAACRAGTWAAAAAPAAAVPAVVTAPAAAGLLFALAVLRPLGPRLDELLPAAVLVPFLGRTGLDGREAEEALLLIRLLTRYPDWFESPPPRLRRLTSDPDARRFLQVNRHEGVVWFRRESFAAWLAWLGLLVRLDLPPAEGASPDPRCAPAAAGRLELLARWGEAAEASGYRLERLLELGDGER